MKVLKFGGTSVGNADRIREVVACVQASPDCVAVVVSAMTGVTDALLEMALSAARGDVSYKGELEALEQRHLDAAEELKLGKYQANLALVLHQHKIAKMDKLIADSRTLLCIFRLHH